MSATPKSVVSAGECLTEACLRANGNVRSLRNLIKYMEGDPSDTALGLMQYICLFAKVAGFDREEFYMIMAHAVQRAWAMETPGVCETYENEVEKKWN